MMLRIKQTLSLSLAALLLTGAMSANAIMLSLEAADNIASASDSLTLDLVISGLTANGPDSLGVFDVDILFDPSLVAIAGHTPGSELGLVEGVDFSDFSVGNVGGGVYDIAMVSLLPAPFLDVVQPGSFTLATLTINTLASFIPGSSTVISVDGVDPFLFLGNADGAPLTATLASATIRNPVPAPGTLFLLGLGLLAARASRR